MMRPRERLLFSLVILLTLITPLAFLPYAFRALMYGDFYGLIYFLLFVILSVFLGRILIRELKLPIASWKVWAKPGVGLLITAVVSIPLWYWALHINHLFFMLEWYSCWDRLLAIWSQGVCGWLMFLTISWGIIGSLYYIALNRKRGLCRKIPKPLGD